MRFPFRNRLKKISLVLVFVILACQLAVTAYADRSTTDQTIAIDMGIGFDKFYKLGYAVPLYFELDNKLKDFNGELQVEMPTEYETIMLYATQVSLPKDSVKKLVVNIPMNRFLSKLKINLVEGKNQIASRTFRIDPGVNMETLVIGVLSDDYDSVKYINSISIQGTGALAARNIRLDESAFPEDLDVLKAFNVIVINNFDTSKLGRKQYEALKKWTMEGGLLVIGTGPSHNKTLAVFKDNFLTGQTGGLKMLQTTALAGFAANKGSDGSAQTEAALTGSAASLTLNVLDIALKESRPIITEGSFQLVQSIDRGSGRIIVAAFDLGMEPLATWIGSATFADRLLSSAMTGLPGAGNYYKGMPEQNVYAMDSAVRNIPELALPKTSYMFIVFALYILLAAPISYIVLKRMDRRELLWLTVPALSLLFSAAVYVSGFGTRMTEPVVNMISILNFDESGSAALATYAGIFTPTKNNIRVEAENGVQIMPLLVNRGNYGSVDGNEQVRKIEAKVSLSPQNAIEFYRTGVWSMKTVMLEDDREVGGKIEGKLNYTGGSFTGTLKNATGFDLEECYIVTSNQYLKLGAIKNGETLNIDVKPSSYFGNRYDLMNAIYKDPYSGPNPQDKLTYEEIKVLRENMQKRQVLEYSFLNRDFGSREAVLLGWSRQTPAQGILINGKKAKRFEKSLVFSDVQVSFRSGNAVEYPYGFIQPNIVNSPSMGNFDEMNKTFFGSGTVEVHYPIDGTIRVEGVKIKYTLGTHNVKQYIWNAKSNAWEKGDYTNFSVEGESIEKYIDGDNLLRLKFEINDDNIQLPEISVKGSVK